MPEAPDTGVAEPTANPTANPSAGPTPDPTAALDHLTTLLDQAGAEWEPGGREGEVVVTLPGDKKLKTVASLVVSERGLSVSAFVVRNPDENHAAVYRFLLRRNLRLPGLGYAIDGAGDVYVVGQQPLAAITEQGVDQLLGTLLDAADAPFNELLALGFLESMKREWAWRIARGESTRNLEAFRDLLTGVENDPRYAPTGPGPGAAQ